MDRHAAATIGTPSTASPRVDTRGIVTDACRRWRDATILTVKFGAFVLTLLVSTTAWAEDPDRLQARGEQLAKDGQFGEAIDVFKAADSQEPTAERACLIGLAYGRRNLYGQAELFFDLCHQRVADGDKLPSWVAGVEAQFRKRLDAANLAPVTIIVKHAKKPRVRVSAFASDEDFLPRTIFLPPGRHVITVTSRGHEPIDKAFEVEDSAPLDVVIDLRGSNGATTSETPDGPASSTVGRNVIILGAGLVVAGAVVHGTWYRGELAELEAAQSPPDLFRYDAHADSYRQARYVTVGLYAAGAITAIIGAVLHTNSRGEDTTSVAVAPTNGGGILSVSWWR